MARRRPLPDSGRDSQLPGRPDELTVYTQAAYVLLSYSSRVGIVEPAGLKEHMIALASDLLEYYKH
ncbi:hypothetical protein ABD76_19955 [Paenibacillus dendritiformis]|uniref:hypothetical protein n=1 Tax=Paenibacillus dendritiformis TaxID=130049 RepID=UPI0018CD0944|nr:hypothetical protein [Paenibacillus dendritiformis]MBG9794638.1 hypothetical protein [Paenibacillus dendritiformis]